MPAGFPVEICISDTNFATLSLNSDYKRLGKIVIKKAVIPIFVTAFSAYIVYKITTEQEAKPQVTVINNITNITAAPIEPVKRPVAQKKQKPHKYQDAFESDLYHRSCRFSWKIRRISLYRTS